MFIEQVENVGRPRAAGIFLFKVSNRNSRAM